MGNTVKKVYTQNSSWTAPAGVYSVNLSASTPNPPGVSNLDASMFGLDNYGKLWAWGLCSAGVGQLGTGALSNQSAPVAVLGGLTFQSLIGSSVGTNTVGGITTSGAMYMWGNNANGCLGNGNGIISASSPVAVLGGLSFINGWSFSGTSFGLTPAGNLYSWGGNASGLLGQGTAITAAVSSPVAVVGGLTFQTMTGNNGVSVYGLTTSGALYAWGQNQFGALGIGNVLQQSSPVAVLGGLTFVTLASYLVNGSQSMFGITNTGALYGWGANSNGQLGVGDVIPRSSPVAVLGGLTFQQVISCPTYTLALTTTGQAYAWGSQNQYQMGTGDLNTYSSPVAVAGGLTFSQLFSNTGSSYGITPSGAVYGWGSNGKGQLGNGSILPILGSSVPVAVLGGLTFASIGIDVNQSAFVGGTTVGGVFYGWGNGVFGQVGNNTATSYSSPVAMIGGLIFKTQPNTTPAVVPVVPGTTYPITIGSTCQFGATSVGFGASMSLTLTYQQ